MQPRFKKFRASFYTKILRLIGYKGLISDVEKDDHYQKVKTLVDGMADGKIHPAIVYRELLAMKKIRDDELAEAKAKEAASDSTAVTDTTAVDTTAAVSTAADSSAN